MSSKKVANPRRIKARGSDGRTVNLASLPLVAYALNCGHLGRDYAIKRWDIVFCPDCGHDAKVATIIAK